MNSRIDGKILAEEILTKLKKEVETEHLRPHLTVFLVGDNHSSLSYIRQKQKAAEAIGATLELIQFPSDVSNQTFKQTIEDYNANPSAHGIIIQLPLPSDTLVHPSSTQIVLPHKDIDGFVHHSKFPVPVAKAVMMILEKIYYDSFHSRDTNFVTWMRGQTIVVAGQGKTAGKPISKALEEITIPIIPIDSKTQNPQQLYKKATIIISCIGRPHSITSSDISQNTILISVGLSKGDDGKLHGDYEEEEIQSKALFYTPTPGGVGPINVACLMYNLVEAARQQR